MTNAKSTKRALISSVIALLVCFTMLLGTTFAWFTDSVTSAGNIIPSGNLDVAMYWAEGQNAVPAADSTDWTDASTGPIFDYAKWEPGYAVARHIKIANEGTLALKYIVRIVANGTVSELANVIDVYYLDPAEQVNRAALTEGNKLGTLTDVLKGMETSAYGELEAGDSEEITLVLKMQETAGNEYMNKSIGASFSVQLLATQLTAEEDSFDDQYDKDADYAITAKDEKGLAAALANGGNVIVDGTITDTTMEAYSATRNVVTLFRPTQDATLSGGKIILNNSNANWGFVVDAKNNVNVTVKDTAIEGNNNWNMHNIVEPGSKLTIENVDVSVTGGNAVYVTGGGVAVLNNVTVDQDGLNAGAQPWAPTAVAASSASTVTINSGTYVGNTYGVYVYNSGARIVINGGTFKAPQVLKADGSYTDKTVRGELVVNGGNFDGQINMTNGFASCTINGGNFTNFSVSTYNPVVINGGTFDADPTAYAKGQVVDNGDGTWTVTPYEVSSATDLADKITAGEAVVLTQDIDLGKIDLTDAITNDVMIDAAGHKITTTDAYGIEATAGKNVTIKNADVEMTKAGDYITYAAGFKIANGDYAGATITLENCTITMANTDWAYAVNMPASVKNLNLVINNCTLEGAIAVQCWGDNNTITITNSKLICNYTTNALYTSYCVVLQDDDSYAAENNTLVIDSCEFLYTGIDNFNSEIKAVDDVGDDDNTVTVTNCTFGDKVSLPNN